MASPAPGQKKKSVTHVDFHHACPQFCWQFYGEGFFFGVEWNTFRFEKVCVGCGESLGFQMRLPAILMLSHCKAYHSPINGRTLLSTAHLEVKVGDGIGDFILREWSTCE
jgi:hypothetical protein